MPSHKSIAFRMTKPGVFAQDVGSSHSSITPSSALHRLKICVQIGKKYC